MNNDGAFGAQRDAMGVGLSRVWDSRDMTIEVDSLKGRLEKVVSENEELKSALALAEQQINGAMDSATRISEENFKLTTELKNLRQTLLKYEAEIAALKVKLQNADNFRTELIRRDEKLTKDHVSFETKLDIAVMLWSAISGPQREKAAELARKLLRGG